MTELPIDHPEPPVAPPEVTAGPAPQRQPRGRPRSSSPREPTRDAPRDGVWYGLDGEILTRSRTETGDIFRLPREMEEDPDWEYQWNAVAVHGNQEVLLDQNMMMAENGWRPCPADRKGLVGRFTTPGQKGSVIRGGQRLDIRPRAMCDAARDAELGKAIQQRNDRDSALTGGKANFNGATTPDMRAHRGARPRGRLDADGNTYGPRPAYQPPED